MKTCLLTKILIGVYNVDKIDADTLVGTIHDVLLRMQLRLSKCRGQCYDGAANMTGSKNGVATQLQKEESRALLTHCYAHALNLAVGDAIKQSKVCKNALNNAFEISRLIKFSPKRNAAFDQIKSQNFGDEDSSTIGIRSFCPTRWTVRATSIASIIENYEPLNMLWDQCLEEALDPDIRGRIIGIKSQMKIFDFLFGLHISKRILSLTDNLSKSLQKSTISASEVQEIAALTIKTLESFRNDESFFLFFELVKQSAKHTGTNDPIFPRRKKAPQRFEIGQHSYQLKYG